METKAYRELCMRSTILFLIPLLLYYRATLWFKFSTKKYFTKATIHFCNGECIVHVGYSCWILYFLKRFTLAKIG
jgi:hypothetical protein